MGLPVMKKCTESDIHTDTHLWDKYILSFIHLLLAIFSFFLFERSKVWKNAMIDMYMLLSSIDYYSRPVTRSTDNDME